MHSTASSRIFHIQTFGCQMNASDSDWLARSLVARGFVEGSFEEAGLHILNTCSVRDKPEQKVYSELGRIARFCKVNRRQGVTVCVGGCVAQQVGPTLARRFPQVRLLFGTDGIARAPEAISRLTEEPGLRLQLLDFADSYEERLDARLEPQAFPDARAYLAQNVPPSVFVNIMQGCDNFCTYCIVPFVRGRQKSRRAEAVIHECRSLLEQGAREITLLGQNVNSYGRDKNADRTSFAELLYKIAALSGLERLRFVTPHPKDIAPEVIAAFAELDCLCPRLHLPLQSGSDRILQAMNRRYDTARYLRIVEDLRKARPDIILSTDIIVGFPGETEEDFQMTMDLMREVDFATSFSFVYSDRPRAKATLLPGKVDRSVALDRLSRLQNWQNQTSDRVLEGMVKKESVVLLEAKSRWNVVLEEDGAGEGGPTGRDSGGSFGGRKEDGSAGADISPEKPAADESSSFMGERRIESWQGKTPEGFIVNVNLPSEPDNNFLARGWEGAMLPVRIEAAARHSLKGTQAGVPW